MRNFLAMVTILGLVLFFLCTLYFIVVTFVQSMRYFRGCEIYQFEKELGNFAFEWAREQEKVSDLLSRFMPSHIVDRVQQMEQEQKTRYAMVSVLFADIEGFAKLEDHEDAERLIDILDGFFYELNPLASSCHVGEITTIGDSYMCAGGMPIANRTNPVDVVLAAMKMQECLERIKGRVSLDCPWSLRIGVHTGSVMACPCGRNKISYDMRGGTVNLASRLGSLGVEGRVNISEQTYRLVSEFFDCTYRGKIPVKNRGRVGMYLVDGIKPHLSQKGNRLEPNEDFLLRMQFVRLHDLEDYVTVFFEKHWPATLYYHSLRHTLDVYSQAEILGVSEGVTGEDMLLLRTAALLHDVGYVFDYERHEELGVDFTRKILPEYYYSSTQIDTVCDLIMATKIYGQPKTLLEGILCDADCYYLGREDYIPIVNQWYQELLERGLVKNRTMWFNKQIDFLQSHQFYTHTARTMMESNKQAKLAELRSMQSSGFFK